MNAIASDPDSQHVFMVDDLGGLMNILTSLVTTTCPPTPTPTATPTPTSTPTPAPFDAAELASQSEYLTVAPGAAISPWIVVRNTGTTTWTPAQYGYNGKGALQGTTGYITRNVAPGDTYRVFWNLNAPTTPGVYDYGFVLRHGTQEFGPYFFVRVTVVGYTISGRVVDTNGAGISGATIRADSSHTATTDSAGNYTLSGLLAGTYTLQPSKGGYAFCPVSRRIIVSSNVSNQDFAGFGATVALGFCPNINGYSFRNADFPGFPRDDLREIDLIQMFGRDKVCWTNDSGCNIKPQAAFWQALMNLNMFFGHCDGMASTSLRFFKELDLSQSFHPGASTAHELALEEVRHHVAYYFVEQFTDPISTYKDQIRQNTPSVILNQLRSAMQSGAPNPTTLFVRQAGEGGHTVTPFAIEDKGGGISWVRVYDNNHPDDLNRYVVIDTANEFWSYRAGTTTTWTGGTGTMGIVPITLYGEQPVCPWCGGSQERAASDNPVMQEVELSGSGHLLVTDAQGRRLGYTGAQFHSEIPGAYSAFIDGGLGIELEPIYKLPLGDGYTILLDGQTVNQPENVAVTQFGPGYAAQVDNVRLQQSVRDYVTISANGSQITYRPNERRAPSLVLAVDDASASYELNVANAEINANQQVSVAVQNNDGRLVYNNAQSSGGHYGLFIRRVSSNGVRLFAHSGLTVAAGDTHYAEYRSWNGRGSMTLQIDHGSNGTIDETLILANEVKRVYLPSIMR